MRKILIIIAIIVVIGLAFMLSKRFKHSQSPIANSENATNQQTGCQALHIISPKENETITSPFTLQTVVDNRNSACHWTVFEAQAGSVEVKDSSGQSVSEGTLKTTQDWMSKNPVTYQASVSLAPSTKHGSLKITITEQKPSGEPGQIYTYPVNY